MPTSVMKRNLFALFIMLSMTVIGQNSNNTSQFSQISLEPSEIQASGLLSIDFDASGTINYKILSNSNVIFTSELIKNQGSDLKKMDFSFLDRGTYQIVFYFDEEQVKSLTFKKL